MKGQYVRGLVKFITEIRNLRTDEEKEFRIKEEIAKIRVNFSLPRLTDYDKKKNLLKILYIQMLGYDIDLGYLEAVQLMASTKLNEKATGYMGCEILLRDFEDVMRLCVNTAIEDLNNPCEHVCSLALTFIANSHSLEMNERLSNEVIKMSMRFTSDNIFLRKKMYMCILRTYKLNPQLYDLNEWFSMVHHILESETSVTCLLSICNLLDPILKEKPKNWELSVDRLVSFLCEIANDNVPSEHSYFTISAPWLTIKILSIFSSVTPIPNSDFLSLLSNSLKTLLDKTSNLVLNRFGHKDSNRSKKLMNLSIYMTKTGILRETIRAVVNWFPYLDNISPQYICNCIRHLYTSVMSQIRLVALEIIEDVIKIRDTFEYIKSDSEFIIHFLNDSDPTIKKKCCLILCGLCDITNWEFIVPELISTLRYSEISIQEYMVPLICSTIDKNLPKNNLYIDLIFKIVTHSPLVSNNSVSLMLLSTLYKENSVKFQEKVVEKCLFYLKDETEITENLLRICAYVLGDYGYLSKDISLLEQMRLFEKYFVIASPECRCVLINTYGKFVSRDNSLSRNLESILERHITSSDVNIQTRSCELLKLLRTNLGLFNKVLTVLSNKNVPKKDQDKERGRSNVPPKDNEKLLRDSGRSVRDFDRTRETSGSRLLYTPKESFDATKRTESYESKEYDKVPKNEDSSRRASFEENERFARDGDYSKRDKKDDYVNVDPNFGLFTNQSFVLLSTDHLKVEVEQAYKDQQSKVLVRVKNLLNSPLYLTKCVLKSPPELQGQEHNQLRELELRPNQAVNHKLSFMFLSDVMELPKYLLEYSQNPGSEPFKYNLQLPVSFHKFMTPLKLDPGSFTKLWNSMEPTQPFVLRFTGSLNELTNLLRLLNFDVVETGNNAYVSGSGVKSTESTEFFCLGMFTLDKKGGVIVSYRASTNLMSQCVTNLTRKLLKLG